MYFVPRGNNMRTSGSSAFQEGALMPPLTASVHNTKWGKSEDCVSKLRFKFTIDPSELEEIRNLHNEWFPVDYSEEFYSSLIDSPDVVSVVAQIDNQIVGLATVGIRNSVRFYNGAESLAYTLGLPNNDASHVAYILTLGVIDELRRHGVASILISEAVKEVRKRNPCCMVISLHVIDYNHAAMRFYEKNGFKKLKIEENFYKLGDDWFSGVLFYMRLNNDGPKPLAQWFKQKMTNSFT
jgi:ribosomal protein S18 acetylase RimI-like enzyme